MKKLIFSFAALSVNSFASTFTQYVEVLKLERPDEADKINHVAVLTNDLVIHYEKAVILGTTSDYEQVTLMEHFDSFMYAADNMCEDIKLTKCIFDLICEGGIRNNLETSLVPCD